MSLRTYLIADANSDPAGDPVGSLAVAVWMFCSAVVRLSGAQQPKLLRISASNLS